nr:putative late blight resistance protein homolog R1A-10 isoform X1 [Ipomoea batatas]
MAYAAVTSLMETLSLHFLQSQPRLPLDDLDTQIRDGNENLGLLQQILEDMGMKDVEMEPDEAASSKGIPRLHGIFNNHPKKKKCSSQNAWWDSILLTSRLKEVAEFKQKMVSLHQNLGLLQHIILLKSEIFASDEIKGLEAEIRDASFKAEERIEMELTTIYLAKGMMHSLHKTACLLRLHQIFNQAEKETDYLKNELMVRLTKASSRNERITYDVSLLGRMRQRGLLLVKGLAHKNTIVMNVKRLFSHLKLLRVVDMRNRFWDAVIDINVFANLVHLRYLSLYTNDCCGVNLFEHWNNMQTFIVSGDGVILYSSELSGIWKMPLLRNFCIGRICSLETPSVVYTNLENISWLDSKLCTKDLFTMIPNLKTLGVDGGYYVNSPYCFYNFVHLEKLEKLSIRRWMNLNLVICSIPWATSLPNLKKLSLLKSNLQWSELSAISMLPNLESFTFGDESLSNKHVDVLHEMLCGGDDMNIEASLCDLNDIECVTFHDNCLDDALYIHDLIGKDRSEGVENDNVKEEVEDKKKTRNESVREQVDEKVRNDEKEFGPEWETPDGGFHQLKRLVIKRTNFRCWNAVGDHFPMLECLEISECYWLKEIPRGFVDITTLALIHISYCRDSLLASSKWIQEEQNNNYGNDALLVRSDNILVSSYPYDISLTI